MERTEIEEKVKSILIDDMEIDEDKVYDEALLKDDMVPIALKRYHCSVVSGTNVALRAVPLVAL